MNRWRLFFTYAIESILITLSIILFPICNSSAATIDELQAKINDRTKTITDLEKEIAQYENQVKDTQKESQNLQSALKQLDLTGKKLLTQISITQEKISITKDTITELGLQIGDKQVKIFSNQNALGEALRNINIADSRTTTETFLDSGTISDFWNDIENTKSVGEAVRVQTNELIQLKASLTNTQNATKDKERELEILNTTLSDQKKIVDQNTAQKNQLLKDTKNKEVAYQKTLAQKKALRDAFEKELNQFQTELKFQIDPSSIPSPKIGILNWPLDGTIRITQYFGNTDFAQAHQQLYNGFGHNGIDLAASLGTPIKAALSGTVEGTGDTDATCPGASYGKWVFIRHTNGLATLYAHLSLIKAYPGQSVGTGEILGYSGSTGYATGPHLHFTVYASQGVKIIDRQSKVCGGTYRMPVADLSAYLNPLSYLPN